MLPEVLEVFCFSRSSAWRRIEFAKPRSSDTNLFLYLSFVLGLIDLALSDFFVLYLVRRDTSPILFSEQNLLKIIEENEGIQEREPFFLSRYSKEPISGGSYDFGGDSEVAVRVWYLLHTEFGKRHLHDETRD
ncbi:hypothetical protein Taro_012618 [Colocasia esculenta]|uniref:Uncharacterized protein n=1 Tax=Colocasia esculenta TaxID=4460 RepID=A0A843U4F2_COLES|nr:hypothetical protein [Colocasia esculenta]